MLRYFVVTSVYFLSTSMAYSREPRGPMPSDMRAWIHSMCSGRDIIPSLQNLKSKISSCYGNEKEVTKRWAVSASENGPKICLTEDPKCAPLLKKAFILGFYSENYSCRDKKLHGPYKVSFDHRNNRSTFNSSVEAEFENGRLTGKSFHRDHKGKVCRTFNYKDGVVDGEGVLWYDYKKRRKYKSVNFSGGKKHGPSVIYREDGSLRSKKSYDRGEIQRTKAISSEVKPSRSKNTPMNKGFFLPKLSYFSIVKMSAIENGMTGSDSTGVSVGTGLMAGSVDCMDISCSAALISLEVGTSPMTNSYLSVEMGLGGVVMFATGYLGAGLRAEDGEYAPQTTIMMGMAFVNTFARIFQFENRDPGYEFGAFVAISLK